MASENSSLLPPPTPATSATPVTPAAPGVSDQWKASLFSCRPASGNILFFSVL